MERNPPTESQSGSYAAYVTSDRFELFQKIQVENPLEDDGPQTQWKKVDSRTTVPWLQTDWVSVDSDEGSGMWLLLSDIEGTAEEPRDTSGRQGLDSFHDYKLLIGKEGDGWEVTADSQAGAFAEAVEVLIREYGLADYLAENGEMPYVPGHRAILNTEPRNPDGSEMRRPKEVVDGRYYVMTAYPKKQKKRYLEKFADRLGVEISFERGWDS